MTGPINTPPVNVPDGEEEDKKNISTAPGVTITEENKYKGTLAIEAFDSLLDSINEEAESVPEQAVDITFNAIGAVASVVAFAADPFAQIFGSAVGWLIEHVDPLRECLDKVTGNPDEVMANSEETKAYAAAIRVLADDQKQGMATFDGWEGAASESYKASMDQLTIELQKMAEATEVRAKIVAVAAMLITVIRDIIRDMIAEFIGALIAFLIEAALAAAVTLGLAIPFLVGKAVAQIAGFVGKLLSKIAKVVNGLRKLGMLVPKLDEALKTLAKAWDRFDGLADGAEIGYEAYSAGKDVDDKIAEEQDKDDKADKKKADSQEDLKGVKKEGDEAKTANDDYKNAKDKEEKEGKEAETAGKTVEKEGKDLETSGKDLEKKGEDLEKKGEKLEAKGEELEDLGKEVEEAAESGDKEAFDEAKAKFDKAKGEFDDLKGDFDDSKEVFDDSKKGFDEEKQEFVDAQKVFAKEQGDVADAAAVSKQKLDATEQPIAEAEKASDDYQKKYETPIEDIPEEDRPQYEAEKAAATDLDTKNDQARADAKVVEEANLDAANKNAAAADANAKAAETGDEADIKAAEKANEEAKTANADVKAKAETAKASGEAAETSYKNYEDVQKKGEDAQAQKEQPKGPLGQDIPTDAGPKKIDQAPVQAL